MKFYVAQHVTNSSENTIICDNGDKKCNQHLGIFGLTTCPYIIRDSGDKTSDDNIKSDNTTTTTPNALYLMFLTIPNLGHVMEKKSLIFVNVVSM